MSAEKISSAAAREDSTGNGRAEAIAALAGRLTHDLNNVLSAVLMAVDLLQETCTGERERKILAAVEESARRGVALNRRLLRLSRGEEDAVSDDAASGTAAAEPD